MLFVSTVAVVLGHNTIDSPWAAMSTLPVALWEFGLGLWLTFKGFKPSPITAAIDAEAQIGRGVER